MYDTSYFPKCVYICFIFLYSDKQNQSTLVDEKSIIKLLFQGKIHHKICMTMHSSISNLATNHPRSPQASLGHPNHQDKGSANEDTLLQCHWTPDIDFKAITFERTVQLKFVMTHPFQRMT